MRVTWCVFIAPSCLEGALLWLFQSKSLGLLICSAKIAGETVVATFLLREFLKGAKTRKTLTIHILEIGCWPNAIIAIPSIYIQLYRKLYPVDGLKFGVYRDNKLRHPKVSLPNCKD